MVTLVNEAIQAFPIHAGTYNGIANSYIMDGKNVIHAGEDCDITFTFPGSNTIVISVLTGQDLAVAENCISVTSTELIWIS
jgi:hypothetical protein